MSSKPVLEPLASTYLRIPVGEHETQARAYRLDTALSLGDRTLLLDYTVISPPLSTRDKPAADSVALSGEQRKAAFYSSRLAGPLHGDVQIVPLSLSALGKLSPLSLETIYSVARHLGNSSDHQTASIAQSIFAAISVQLYRGNSGLLRAYRQVSRPNQ